MIRKVKIDDAKAIAEIYNHYVLNTTISFETEAVSEKEMGNRITHIASHYPYLVYEHEGKIEGYCYIHPWKERAAYRNTMETTIYIDQQARAKGIGRLLMVKLIQAAWELGVHVLIACITDTNTPSCNFHQSLGFRQASHFHEVGNKFSQWLGVIDYELILSND